MVVRGCGWEMVKKYDIVDCEPKRYGSPIINIKCAECGAMFSEQCGHTCRDECCLY